MRRDPLIIGGGPAGTAAAITLARAGRRPLLIERTGRPADKVCGDFLSFDTIQRARALGVDPVSLGAVPIRYLRVSKGAGMVQVTLPFPALGVSRRALDAALLRCAGAAGAIVQTGQPVRCLTRDNSHWIAQVGQTPISARTVFLATGKHDLRDFPRSHGGAIGMKMYLTLAPQAAAMLHAATELFLFPGGYAGLQNVEDGQAVLCMAVRKLFFQRYGSTWVGLVAALEQRCARFAAMMAGAQPRLPRALAVAGIPYGYRAAAASTAHGLFRLGDQAAVIPSLTGDGLAIALFSGQQAAAAWLMGADAVHYHRHLAKSLTLQMRVAGLLHHVGLNGAAQTGAMPLLRLFPGLLRHAATHTRLKGDTLMPLHPVLGGG